MFTPLNPSVFYERERGKAYFLLCGYLAVRFNHVNTNFGHFIEIVQQLGVPLFSEEVAQVQWTL